MSWANLIGSDQSGFPGRRFVHLLRAGGSTVANNVHHVDSETALGQIGCQGSARNIQIERSNPGYTCAVNQQNRGSFACKIRRDDLAHVGSDFRHFRNEKVLPAET
jgi:hypothetical protein